MASFRVGTDKIEETVLTIFLAACVLLAALKDVFPVLDKGLTAAMFAALFFLLRQVRDTRLAVGEIGHTEIFLATDEEFYRSLKNAVQRAEREVRATYFRTVPPSRLTSRESAAYFQEILAFARKKGTVRRLIGVSNDAIADWCAEQADQVAKHPRYHVRVIDTRCQPVEPMSVCIVDDDVMYMAFSGSTDNQLGGIREDAPKLVSFHQSRFEQLWADATDLAEFAALRS
jgi:hypothetical protein